MDDASRSGRTLRCLRACRTGVGSDVVAVTASARREADTYVLSGERMWISLASVADSFLVSLGLNPCPVTDRQVVSPLDTRTHAGGLSALIGEREMAGVSTGEIHGKLGSGPGPLDGST